MCSYRSDFEEGKYSALPKISLVGIASTIQVEFYGSSKNSGIGVLL